MSHSPSAWFEVTLHWQSAVAAHCERYFARLEADVVQFPPELANAMAQLQAGECCSAAFAAGELVPAWDAANLKSFPVHLFDGRQRGMQFTPKVGRFYPQGFAWQALECTRNNFQPLRVIAHTDTELTVDLNHPLACYPLTLTVRSVDTMPASQGKAFNGAVHELVTVNGVGLQAPYPGLETDFYSIYPFTRADERGDNLFYSNPRFVQHLDKTAIAQVVAWYGRLLQPGMQVLDLMSSWVSHLPVELTVNVTGLGMNATELAANPRLSSFVVQDLNANPRLPFADQQFDAVICTVSVEYLTQPLAVMRELVRVTRAGGWLIMTFSERWFPPKVIELWAEMHPFERLGLVLDYFRKTQGLDALHTETIRGLPRPRDDAHSRQMPLSDPLYAVWGRVTTSSPTTTGLLACGG
ncbi:MAG: methyltransferase domain-containing protein [Thiothrix sp.]